MTSNRKIINATPVEADGIKFKSKMELLIYKTLKDRGFHPAYEPTTYEIFEGFKPTVKCLSDGKEETTKIRSITYTPDFYFKYKDYDVFIEVKGWQNDVYSIKKKLFRKYLETKIERLGRAIFLEVHTKKGLLACLEYLDSLEYIDSL